ncbi:FtsW/RodA/SpoVE family cell cycle protein [Buchananella hordeovulneris]|uniref:Probable peptidoglycan glycosyltransferase FtsW n=1 Tax=Buchananella hordeovulneris TaxID=52770 RepID=A0A1Q5PVU0_9ACTO|nr:FtsW/RodA/SpoVE family cell cycle protein [Buchananella hordeovulneris]MDO5080589.1 FtsW/RodA/SpoVE family cell cycle protein [Buchananella hordeovulneris]OKL51530.1 hypothetical protein BSZ40_06695 [Buchananella hordeovulneris]RRD44083.1 hypothetical protein EII13_05085 [Buchananella hordeovulneris]
MLSKQFERIDRWFTHPRTSARGDTLILLVLTGMLAVAGFLVAASLGAISGLKEGQSIFSWIGMHTAYFLVGVVCLVVGALVPAHLWRLLSPALYVLGLILLALVFTPLGEVRGGNRAWIALFGITIQPSEFAKLAMILLLARIIARPGFDINKPRDLLLWLGGPVLVGLGLVLLGKDLGSALVFIAFIAATLWVAGLRRWWFISLGGLAVCVVTLLTIFSSNRSNRIADVFRNHGIELEKEGPEQVDHAVWALANGGLTGTGPGGSKQKWSYLPAADSDFIFSIWGEEYGFVGAVALVLIYIGLVCIVLRIGMRSLNPFIKLAACGIAFSFATQTFINMGVATAILPVIGVPLPFISAGGSSLVSSLAAVGVLVSFSQANERAEAQAPHGPGAGRRSSAVLAGRSGK